MLVGGGTGGHAGPILAIYQELKKIQPGLPIHVVGVGSEEEKYFFSGLPLYHKIKSGKLHRYFTLKNITESAKFCLGFIESIVLLLSVKPRLIFSKGGYTSMPLISVANLLGIPYFLHESDIEMGRTNKVMSKNAKKVFVCFPVEYYSGIDRDKLVWSGPILREDIGTEKDAKKIFNFTRSNPVIFLTGGSQGSLSLTKSMIAIAPKLLGKYSIIHQAGKHSIKIAKEFWSGLSAENKQNYYLTEFLSIKNNVDKMWEAIKAADLVITRAGSTIAEVAIMGKPMILVPWKHAAQNHQLKNAKYLVKHHAAVMIEEEEFSSETLLGAINAVFSKKDHDNKTVSEVFPKDGVKKICDEIIKEIEEK